MGQQSSSGYDGYDDFGRGSSSRRGGGGGGGGVPSEAKTCYYELLAVERTATQDDIKKAYKRKALELHPDRNYKDTERATKLFAEVQAAYEVLSDPQERAWYDSHRDQILRGDTSPGEQDHAPPSNVTTAPTVLRWIAVFARPRSYDDKDPAGFFTVISKAFAQLAEEEVAAADWAGEEAVEYPSFGNSTKPYEGRGGVREFYAAWTNFATAKSFAWEDLYRYSDAPDRRIKRLMEKENQRAREAAKREFNDAVRGFVMFVRKRDPRYLPNTQTEAQRQQVVRDMAKEQARKQRAQNAKERAEFKIADWAKGEEGTEVEEWLSSEPEDDSEEEEEEEIEVFECIVCRKKFGSQGQMDAHENSKKHRQAVEKLKRQMKAEDREFDLDRDVRGREKKEDEFIPVGEDGEVEDFDDEDEDAAAELEAYKAEGAVRNEEMPPTASDGDEDEDEKEATNNKEETQEPKSDEQPPVSPGSPSESEDSDHISREKFEERILGEYDHVTDRFASASLLSDVDSESNTQGSASTPPPQQKMGKAKAKRAKRAAAAAAGQEKDASSAAATEFVCEGCNNGFGSKTRLFTHLKENPGHAKLVAGGGKGKKGKGKR